MRFLHIDRSIVKQRTAEKCYMQSMCGAFFHLRSVYVIVEQKSQVHHYFENVLRKRAKSNFDNNKKRSRNLINDNATLKISTQESNQFRDNCFHHEKLVGKLRRARRRVSLIFCPFNSHANLFDYSFFRILFINMFLEIEFS